MASPVMPIGRCFVSVEGESSRVGEVTGFLHLADGIERTVDDAERIAREAWGARQLQRIVVDTCELTYRNYEAFLRDLAVRLTSFPSARYTDLVWETRGEALCHKAWAIRPPIYLNYTPGLTKPEFIEMLKPGLDEAKVLVSRRHQLFEAVDQIKPLAELGIASFVLVRTDNMTERRAIFHDFLQLSCHPAVRMMLVEHEVIGIL